MLAMVARAQQEVASIDAITAGNGEVCTSRTDIVTTFPSDLC